MINRLFVTILGCSMLVTLGWGCAKNPETPPGPLFERGGATPDAQVEGAMDVLPDGKGAVPFELCVSTKSYVAGPVWLYAANNTEPRKEWSQWFSASPVATGKAGEEICGALGFDIQTGDKVYINGMWSNKKRFLINNRGSSGSASDDLKEIWLDDQFYEIGKDCEYEDNNMGGYNLVCTVR